jgi:hypothetical protein
MKRRTVLGGTGGIALLSLAGCLGAVGMDEHEASPAGVDPTVREETGYEQTNIEELVVERTVDLPGTSEEVTVRNYLTEHKKGIDLPAVGTVEAATFIILTSPQISIVGREFNPISEMDSTELVELIEADFDEINDVEHVSDGVVTILEQETTESLFEAEAQINGVPIDVNIHITESVQTTSDHLVTIGVYPTQLESLEADNIAALMAGVIEDIE